MLRLAALLHDAGHACFSHAAEEEVILKGTTHEELTVLIVTDKENEGFSGQSVGEALFRRLC